MAARARAFVMASSGTYFGFFGEPPKISCETLARKSYKFSDDFFSTQSVRQRLKFLAAKTKGELNRELS
jgi:hypothetical protein